MQMNGEWVLFSDGVERPVIRGEALASDGSWVRVPFLVDTGADRTVFSAGILALLRLQPVIAQERLSGLGGVVSSLIITTQIRLTREDAGKVVFRSQFAAVRGYPETFSHRGSEIMQHPCGNETQDDHRDRAC
jgi:predicted aspartyl protease